MQAFILQTAIYASQFPLPSASKLAMQILWHWFCFYVTLIHNEILAMTAFCWGRWPFANGLFFFDLSKTFWNACRDAFGDIWWFFTSTWNVSIWVIPWQSLLFIISWFSYILFAPSVPWTQGQSLKGNKGSCPPTLDKGWYNIFCLPQYFVTKMCLYKVRG